MGVEVYDLPFEGVEKALMEWVEEALELRHGEAGDPEGPLALPDVGAGPDAVLGVLQRTRVRMDRTEELKAKARQALGRIHRARMAAEFHLLAKKSETMQDQGARRTKEFVSADEKRSDAIVATLNEHRDAHKLARAESVAEEAFDVIKDCYWGLDKIRTELLEMNKVHMALTHMETTT